MQQLGANDYISPWQPRPSAGFPGYRGEQSVQGCGSWASEYCSVYIIILCFYLWGLLTNHVLFIMETKRMLVAD